MTIVGIRMLRALTNDAGNAVFVRERPLEDSTPNVVLSKSRPHSILTKVTKPAVPKQWGRDNVRKGDGRKSGRLEQVVVWENEVTVKKRLRNTVAWKVKPGRSGSSGRRESAVEEPGLNVTTRPCSFKAPTEMRLTGASGAWRQFRSINRIC